jgi:transposase InsO family protein
MPWKELNVMKSREEFVLRAREPGVNFSALCAEYGVARKTGYKWLKRYQSEGLGGLEDESRRPNRSPLEVSGDIVADVVEFRLAHAQWGPTKLAELVRTRRGPESCSARTVARILVRVGLARRTVRRRRQGSAIAAPRPAHDRPNQLWTVDFKGWWLSQNRERCEPLTVRDAYSRYVLGIVVLGSTSQGPVIEAFKGLFEKYGMPEAILVDNGTPWIQPGSKLGLTQLSAWWLALGIEVFRSRPATPSDNGGHERMHRDMATELEAFRALNRKAQQEACDRWRHDFNHVRPHEALGLKTPAQVYQRSRVKYDGKPVLLTYPERYILRRVSTCGQVRNLQTYVFLSTALAGYEVGFEPMGKRRFAVWFGHRRLGTVDFDEPHPRRITADPWNTATRPDDESTGSPQGFTGCESPPGPPSGVLETEVMDPSVEVLNDDDEWKVSPLDCHPA